MAGKDGNGEMRIGVERQAWNGMDGSGKDWSGVDWQV